MTAPSWWSYISTLDEPILYLQPVGSIANASEVTSSTDDRLTGGGAGPHLVSRPQPGEVKYGARWIATSAAPFV